MVSREWIIRKWIKEHWEELYKEGNGKINFGVNYSVRFHVEEWDSSCIEWYAEKKGYRLEEEDDWWDVMWEEVNEIIREEGWDGYVYIEPEECGVPYGITIFYKIIRVW